MRLGHDDTQLNTFIYTESHESKIGSGLGDLIGLAADKWMKGEKLNKLNINIDKQTLMDDIK